MTNKMREIKIEKVVLGVGGTEDALEKGAKLLKLITGREPSRMESRKRIPSLSVRPGLKVGAIITVRKDAEALLRRMLAAVDNRLRKKQISENTFSFGIKEYIEIPGMEYQRDLGILGLDVTITFKRAGRRVGLRRMKTSKVPRKQRISKEEIIKFMEDKFNTKFR